MIQSIARDFCRGFIDDFTIYKRISKAILSELNGDYIFHRISHIIVMPLYLHHVPTVMALNSFKCDI